MTAIDDLLQYLFDGKQSVFYTEFEAWMRTSRRFRAFAVTYRDKIHTKLKNVRDENGLKDLRAELETAALLLSEDRFALEYEKYAASRQRSPDFTVTFKTHTAFNVEVRRIRSIEMDDDGEALGIKLIAILCDKTGQMPPSVINILWLVSECDISEASLTRAVSALRQLAENKAEDFFTRRGFTSAADFIKQHRQLSGIMLRKSGDNSLWLNPIARHKLPPELVLAIQRLKID